MALKFKIIYINSNNEQKTIINSDESKFNHNLEVIAQKNFTLVSKSKLYPVGNWNIYQHVFYNAVDRAWNSIYDLQEEKATNEELDKAYAWLDTVEDMLNKFDSGCKDENGMVYVEYSDYNIMKNIIGSYAIRHGGRV